MKFSQLLMFFILSLMVAGCGGGGSGGTSPPAQPTAVLLHLKTDGTLTGDSIRGITITINLPPGVNIQNGTSSPDITLSGVAAGKAILMSYIDDTISGKLTVLLTWADPIEQVGEFATINFGVSSGFFPQATDFSIDSDITKTNVTGITGSSITTLSVSIDNAAFTY